MHQRKINPGNAECVIQRGNNITIVPFDSDARVSVASVERRSIRWPLNIDVIGGGAPDNPDNIPVTDDLYPGWRIYAYSCANEPCSTALEDPLFIEIQNLLGEAWSSAHMVMRINHVGSTPTDYLFRVQELSIRSDLGGISLNDLTYDNSGMINTEGVYSFQIAATASDGTKRMTMFTNGPGWLQAYMDSDEVEAAYNNMTNPVTVYPQGLFKRYDYNFMYPTGPNQISGGALVTIPFIIRFTP